MSDAKEKNKEDENKWMIFFETHIYQRNGFINLEFLTKEDLFQIKMASATKRQLDM